jgi:hypothetical protein
MHRFVITLGVVALVACTRHQVDDCLPACEADDQVFFAECVAEGLPGECQAGHRRCCALAAECVGGLDDQTVETTRPVCEVFGEVQCWRPCTDDDEVSYDQCVTSGTSFCRAGDERCCVEESNCLGSLGDWYIEADGCCADSSDCADGETCDDVETFTCVARPVGCGDGAVVAPETCDDGNAVTEDCTYGAMSCSVCGDTCTMVAGATSYCGDGTIDSVAGEECDPPGAACDAACSASRPATCSNGSVDGEETDVDCGGTECAACAPGRRCRVTSDCAVATPECNGTVVCEAAMGLCLETTDCDDLDACTDDLCEAGVGCSHPALDEDADGFGPLDLGCGRDCDDFDGQVFPGATELCDGIDNNCVGGADETC